MRDWRAAIAAWSCVGYIAAISCAVTLIDRDLAARLDLAAVRYAKKLVFDGSVYALCEEPVHDRGRF